MKVTDLKRTPLEEGFIDNLVGKALGMAGGDGITGFIRSLQGEGAALKKLSDAIEVGLVGALRRVDDLRVRVDDVVVRRAGDRVVGPEAWRG